MVVGPAFKKGDIHMIDYLIEITTSQKITYRFFKPSGKIDIESLISTVMSSEKCPRRSITDIKITKVGEQ